MTTAQTLLSYRAAVERHRQVTEQLGSRKHEPYIIVDGKWAAVNAALDEHRASLLAFDGVQGVAIGWRRWRGVRIPQRALIVFVRSKLPDEEVRGAALPKTLTTDSTRVRVDVVQTGTFQRHSIRSGGDEIGTSGGEELGTLGCFALDNETHRAVALTAMHVTRGLECPPESGATMSFDGKQFGAVTCGSRTGIDAAKIATVPSVVISFSIRGIGAVNGWRRISTTDDHNRTVRVFGATSGMMVGKIREPLAVISNSEMHLNPAIIVEVPTHHGDSGAVIVDSQNRALGMLVGEPDEFPGMRAFSPMSLVLDRLKCDIPPGERT